MSKKKRKKTSQPTPSPSVSPKTWWGVGILVLCVAVVAVVALVISQNQDKAAADSGTYNPPALEEGVTYTADIEVADYGTITVELDQEAAPVTCANFVQLAESGFYDGLTFHRILGGTMMQGGDPLGTGYGGSEHTIVGEFSSNGYDNPLSHTRGAISMARSNDPNSASSQFFIVQEDQTYWDGSYAVFGYVTQGMDVVDDICNTAQPSDGNGTIPAQEQPVITSVTIHTQP